MPICPRSARDWAACDKLKNEIQDAFNARLTGLLRVRASRAVRPPLDVSLPCRARPRGACIR